MTQELLNGPGSHAQSSSLRIEGCVVSQNSRPSEYQMRIRRRLSRVKFVLVSMECPEDSPNNSIHRARAKLPSLSTALLQE